MLQGPNDLARLSRERDLYRKLLELRRKDEIDLLLREALALIVEVTGADAGYLELEDRRPGLEESVAQDERDRPHGSAPQLHWTARGCSADEIDEIRSSLSRGVIAEAIASGRTIVTASALSDPRFRERGSVRKNQIGAVLCAPIGSTPPLGVLYLQGRAVPGQFREGDQLLAEEFAETVAVFADRLLIRRRGRDGNDPTVVYRTLLGAGEIVGRSAALARLLRGVSVAAPLEVGVLLTGSSGAGKTRIAKLIHDNSKRADGPFIELNCATLTETLLESELFGHVRGAFSGADRDKAGLVGAAEGGTLFLDEVAEIPPASQAKLLKFLEAKEYRAVGAEKWKRADVRVIAATNADLKSAVANQSFREDLYYRLEVMPLAVPSLAERREDIAALVRHFCHRAIEEFRLPSIEPSEGALRAAEAAEWPGNIRQLANAVQRAVLNAASEGVLRLERRHLFADAPDMPPLDGQSAALKTVPSDATFQDATRTFQAALVRRTLRDVDWNVTEAAARLDLTRAHVYNLIRAFGLSRARG